MGGPRARGVLARLIVAANHVVAADALAGELWPDLGAARAGANLQVRIAELRRMFGPAGVADRLVTRPPGYLLVAGPEEVDVARFDHWLPVWLPGDARQDLNVGLTWRAWQDSNPRPAA